MNKPSLLHIVKSVLSAMIGVQSDSNREVDFKQGSLPVYLVVGFLATVIFIITIAKIALWVAG
jgi:hypothetical protein